MRWLLAKMMLAVASIALATPPGATACTTCVNVLTISEELALADVVAIGKVVSPTSSSSNPASTAFEIVQVLKGKEYAKKLPDRIEIPGVTTASATNQFLILGAGPQQLAWGPAYPASRRLAPYLREILRLPKQGPERLAFYYRHLEDLDEMIARDAYDELARADYPDIKRLKRLLDHDRLVAWIKDDQVPTSRRRLYLTLIGVCGNAQDAHWLERLIRSPRRSDTRGLESLITCYLTLRGATGLDLVNELYLANRAAEYAETYSAIMAIRFHLREESIISKDQLVASLRLMLQRPDLADLVIPDLASAKDWQSTDRLMNLFREADAEKGWVRVPVINYLRACPLPQAKEYLEECERVDPAAFERAFK
jgi:hypothetical protein